MKYIELNGLKLYLPSSVSLEKGKKAYDYSSNWSRAKKAGNLPGKEYRFIKGTEEHKLVRQLVKEKYGHVACPCANEDCKLIDEERALAYLNTSTVNASITGVSYGMANSDTLTIINKYKDTKISSIDLAERLGIEHKNLLATIKNPKYKPRIEFNKHTHQEEKLALLPLDNTRGPKGYYALLNFRQALFVGTLSHNSEEVVEFKDWLTCQFEYLFNKEIENVYSWLPSNNEKIVQAKLVQEASFTDTPLKQEVVIDESGHRVDLMYVDNSIAIELKTRLINLGDIRKVLFEKDYFHSLKTKFSNFQTLIFCSTVGISEEAKPIVDSFNPYIVYEDIDTFSSRFSKDKPKLKQKDSYLLQAA